MSRRAELISIYARIGRTYVRWAPSLLVLAVIVFVPLGLVHTIVIETDLGSLDFHAGAKLFAAAAAAAPDGPDAIHARIYQAFALLMADRADEARAVLTAIGAAPAANPTQQL
ncbi:MAG: hypothetical protein ACHQCI_02285 [Solirubrobacterales bacterium]